MTQEKFKLPRCSYEELCRIIRAYGRLDKPAQLGKVTQISGVATTSVSANNAFLAAVEIIEGGKAKIATNKGRELAKALDHDLEEEISRAWQAVVKDNDFLNKMVTAVRIRKGMDISSLEAHIAYSAGEPKTKYVMVGARTVIDILRNSGLVKEEDDRIVPTEEIVSAEVKPPVSPVVRVPPAGVTTPTGVSLHIEVNIDAKPSELEGLGEKLKALIESLSTGSVEEKKTGEDAQRKG